MGTTYYNLYDKIHNPINLWWAYKNAARGKRYTPAVATFEYDLEKNLIEIEQDLKNEGYEMGGYHSFRIDKPKRRLVNAAPFRDRVVHHALMNVIEPLFERQFIFDSYANRNRNDPTNTNNNVGFRCSRLLPGVIFNQNVACSRTCRACCGCERRRFLSAERRANIQKPRSLEKCIIGAGHNKTSEFFENSEVLLNATSSSVSPFPLSPCDTNSPLSTRSARNTSL